MKPEKKAGTKRWNTFHKSFDEILRAAAAKDCIIAGFNVYGVDDASVLIEAAEELRAPVILMVNKLALKVMCLENWADVLNALASRAKTPVCVHLDHTTEEADVFRAVKAGYDSIMFDGSRLPFSENVEMTQRMVRAIHANGLIAEAEIGMVSYSDSAEQSVGAMTDPREAEIFARETRVDWLAVSVGNVHRMESQATHIDFARLESIQKGVDAPLVVHGSTGIPDADLKKMMKTRMAKANIGTALRMAFGKTLQEVAAANPAVYDREALLREPLAQLKRAAKIKMQTLGLEGFLHDS